MACYNIRFQKWETCWPLTGVARRPMLEEGTEVHSPFLPEDYLEL